MKDTLPFVVFLRYYDAIQICIERLNAKDPSSFLFPVSYEGHEKVTSNKLNLFLDKIFHDAGIERNTPRYYIESDGYIIFDLLTVMVDRKETQDIIQFLRLCPWTNRWDMPNDTEKRPIFGPNRTQYINLSQSSINEALTILKRWSNWLREVLEEEDPA